jgi:hypothetical protein
MCKNASLLFISDVHSANAKENVILADSRHHYEMGESSSTSVPISVATHGGEAHLSDGFDPRLSLSCPLNKQRRSRLIVDEDEEDSDDMNEWDIDDDMDDENDEGEFNYIEPRDSEEAEEIIVEMGSQRRLLVEAKIKELRKLSCKQKDKTLGQYAPCLVDWDVSN